VERHSPGDEMTRKAKIALISLYSTDAIGLRYLVSTLRTRDYPASMIFFKELNLSADSMTAPTEKEYSLLIDLIRQLQLDIVGISLRSSYASIARKITERIKKELSLPVIWGGTHPTVAPQDSIGTADMICIGEGEYPLLELMEAITASGDFTGIPNIWTRNGQKIIRNDVRPLIEDLDALPFPEYGGSGKYFIENETLAEGDPVLGTYNLNIMASRGCPYHCSYCCNSTFNSLYKGKGPRIRRRTVGNVFDEISALIGKFPKLKRMDFIDEVFAWDKDWTTQFVQRYKKEVNLPFQCAQHPNMVDREILLMLKDAGLERVEIGVQSGSERVRKEFLERPVSDRKLLETANLVHERGLVPFYDFIVDNPFESEEEQRRTLDFMLKLPRPHHLHIFSLKYFPATEMTKRALAAGYISEQQVEGNGTDPSQRMFVTVKDPRPARDQFWIALYSMTSKSFIPKSLIRWLSKRSAFRQNPKIVVWIASMANTVKLGLIALTWLFQGKPVFSTIRAAAGRRTSPIV
jgi:anaerobic magnesium-protoporphyrin IX monomethyl ester cyclase